MIARLRFLLLPFSLIYGLVIWLRNKLFDWSILKQKEFDLPVICIGNLTVGGTGKTPHTEYLIHLLHEKLNLAVLSRGYKRKTSGYFLAGADSSPEIIGDEPFQIYSRNPDIKVAVCENRVEGIERLITDFKELETILLDDAYQHRYVKPTLSILLIDSNRPVYKDFVFPAGNLREGRAGIKRANIVVVTKCAEDVNAETYNQWFKKLRLSKSQQLYFSGIEYGNLQAIFESNQNMRSIENLTAQKARILIVTGIAEPKPLIDYIKSKGLSPEIIRFADHHHFEDKDILKIKEKFNSIAGVNKVILTTEKDAVRFKHMPNFLESLKDVSYFLPISIEILNDKKNDFDNNILKVCCRK